MQITYHRKGNKTFGKTHLSKHSSDLKQNGTQEKTPFSSTVFHALSHGVIRFVASVSSKNHLLTGWNSLTANQGASIQWFLKLTLATKRSTPCERVWKTVQENGVFSCVQFYFRSLEGFERCDMLIFNVLEFESVQQASYWQHTSMIGLY